MKQRISQVIERVSAGAERVWRGHKKQVVAVGAIAAALIIVAAGLLISAGHPSQVAQASPSPSVSQTLATPTESPTDVVPSPSASDQADPNALPVGWTYSDLDGVLAPADLAHRLPLAIMIDDNSVARPQSGFSSASIVYQAPADGGEDRYMIVFQEGTASDIGPVRSARPYYVYWAAEYKALFGHFGGDAKSLQQVVPSMSQNIYDQDDLRGGSCPYHRIDTRASPHNAYTNSTVLISCAGKRGYPATYQNLPVRTFVDDTPASDRPESQSVTIPYRTGAIGYQYDPTSNSYFRIVGGEKQVDPANSALVLARNIVVMFQVVTIDPQSEPGYARPVVANVGSGKAIVFKEGKAITGTWKKTSNTALTRLYDNAGAEIPFVRGEIFMQSVPVGTAVTYK
ncbi:MAG: DUF3048 domain-containing protein [Candidatus Limnocylindrales bacterium]